MADENKKAGDQDQKSKIDTAKILYDYAKEQLRIEGDFRDMLKESLRELKNTLKTYKDIESVLGTLDQSQINTKEIQSKLSKITKDRYKNQLDLSELEKNTASVNKEKVSTYIKAVEILAAAEKDRFNINRTTSDKELEDAIILHQQNVDNLNSQLGLLESVYAQKLATEKIDGDIAKQLEIQLGIEKKVQKTIGSAGALAKILGTNIQVGTEAHEAMVEAARKGYSSTRVMLIGFKKAIKEGLEDPLIAVGMIAKANNAIFSGIKKAFSFVKDIAEKILGLITGWNDRVFELGKNIGVSEADSRAMMNNFQNMAINSGPLFLNSKKISETFTEMTNSLGLMVPMDNEMLQTATLLQRQFGLSAEDLASIYANSALSGKSFKDTFDTIEGIRGSEGGRLKTMMTTKQIVGEISKVSSLVLLNFKGNVPALASAVVESKRLGLSLDQVAATTNGFLDFESSISKEFEAQLLTGKDLNLQRLRYLALTHDTAGLMAEIGKRIPSMLEFEKMNTIERQSYAEAMNMSEEGLAEIIKKQEIAAKLGVNATDSATQMYEELKKSGLSQAEIAEKMKDAGAQQYYTAAMSEKISTFIDNIKTTLGQMLEGELGKTIDNFLNLMNNTKTWHMWMEKIQGVVKGIGSFFANLPEKIQAVLKVVSVLLGVLAIAEAGIGLAMLPVNPLGAAAAFLGAAKIGAAAAAAGYAASTVGDMISVSKNAVANQSYSPSDNTNTGTAANTGGTHSYVQQPITVVNLFDSQTLSTLTIQNAKQSSIVDHSSDIIKSKSNAKIVESKKP